MKKSQQYYILFMCFSGMMLAALGYSFRGFFVPTYKAEFGINNTQMGLIIGFAQVASMVFAYWGGRYCLKLGPKRIIAFGYVLNGLSILLIVFAKSWVLLLAGYCGMSSGMALMVLGLNTILPMVTLFSQAIIMNFVHGIFGFGSTIYQKGLGWFLSNDYNWRTLFLWSVGIFLVNGILVLFSPGEPSEEHKNHKSTLIHKKLSFALFFALMFYVSSEFLVGSWIINYFQEGYGFSPKQAAYYTTLFYGVFTAGRLIGGFILHHIDRFKGIIFCSVTAAILILIGQFVGGALLYSIGVSGLFFSIVYPTTITLVNDTYGKNSAYFMGISSTTTALGVFIFNLMFGYLNDLIGVKLTFTLIPLCLVLSMISFVIAYYEYKKITLNRTKAASLHRGTR
jgi:fucose permease